MSNALLRPATAVSWESLGFAGDVRGHLATWFGLHPLTSKTVYVAYDRLTGQASSRPRCPELEAVARFATLVQDEWATLRRDRRDDTALAELATTQAAFVAAHPDDEGARARVEAIGLESRKRRVLGAIATAQRDGGDVRAMVARDLFTDGC